MVAPNYTMPGGDTLSGGGARRGFYAPAPAGSPKHENDSLIPSTQGRFYVQFPTPDAAARFYDNASQEAQPYVAAMMADRNRLHYVDVFIQSAGLSLSARHSVTEGLTDSFGFYTTGDHPATISLSMTLLNTRQDQWFDAWALVREALTRPWQLARGNAALWLKLDTRLYNILPLSESFTLTALQETMVPFALQALVLQTVVLPLAQPWRHTPTTEPVAPPALPEVPTDILVQGGPDRPELALSTLRARGSQLTADAATVNRRVVAQQLQLQPGAAWLV